MCDQLLNYYHIIYLYSYSLPEFSNNLLAFCLSAEGNLFIFYASWSQNEYPCLTMIPWNLVGERREKIGKKGIKDCIYTYLLSFYGNVEGRGERRKSNLVVWMIHWKLYMLPRLKKVLCICKSIHGKVPYAYNHLSFIQCILHENCMVFFFSPPPNSEIHRSESMLNTKSVKVHDSLWQNSHSVWIKYIWWNSKQARQYVHKWDCWFPRRERDITCLLHVCSIETFVYKLTRMLSWYTEYFCKS